MGSLELHSQLRWSKVYHYSIYDYVFQFDYYSLVVADNRVVVGTVLVVDVIRFHYLHYCIVPDLEVDFPET